MTTLELKSLSARVISKKNIGYLLDKHGGVGCGAALLCICNDVIWGNFEIPTAIGFSTPLRCLGDLTEAEITFIVDKPNEERFKEWKSIYNTECSRKITPNIVSHSSDCVECAICLETYEIGEKLLVFPCGHKFHAACTKSDARMLCPCCRGIGTFEKLDGMSKKRRIHHIMKERGF